MPLKRDTPTNNIRKILREVWGVARSCLVATYCMYVRMFTVLEHVTVCIQIAANACAIK